MNKWLIGGGLILAIAYLSYQWGWSDRDTLAYKDAQAAQEAARATERKWQSKLGVLEKDLLNATDTARARAEHDQRAIRQTERKYKKVIQSCEGYSDYIAELDSLLNSSVCRSELPSKDLQPVCDDTDLQITHADRMAYFREVIERYEQEGLRCNGLRAQIQVE